MGQQIAQNTSGLDKEPRLPRKAKKRAAGEGSIYRRPYDGLWVAALMVGRRPDGKPDRRVVYARSQGEVLRKLDELRGRARDGSLGDAELERATVAEFLLLWLESIKDTVRPATWRSYEQISRLYITPTLGSTRLAALRPDRLIHLYASLRERGLAPQTVHSTHMVLHRALGRAMRWGAAPRNVASLVDPPRVPRTELHVPTVPDIVKLLDTAVATDDRLSALWTLAAYSGCRQGELLGLQWADVDLEGGSIAIRRSLIGIRKRAPLFGEPKTTRSRRSVALPPEAVRALVGHRVRQDADRRRVAPYYAEYDLVFASTLGTPSDARNVLRDFKLALARAGLRDSIRFHDLRHFAATLMLSAGVHPKVASDRLGHSAVAITLDRYTHVVQGLDRDAAERMEKALRDS